ncbi:hypothetical protein BG000_004015 [Podila horticola]|nr:hypothetical protein BG000_004015 [Podila horticola]
MGGSAQDLELLNDIDSGSEIEGEEVTPSKPKSAKKAKASPAGDAEEPGLKNEVASFMKSLFGNALMDPKKMNEAAEEEEEDDDDMEELEDGGESDQDVGSEGSWETEEDVNSGDDSGHDSMDDLPEELKVIAAQLEDKKRKTAPVSDTPAKKSKTESKKDTSTPAKKSVVTEKNLKAKELGDVKKQVSAMLGKPSAKPSAPAPTPASVKKSTKSAPPKDIKGAKAKTTTKSSASSGASPGWKLGDGWSKGFEDSDDDISPSKKAKGKKGPSPSQKAASQRGKGRGVTKSKK